MNPWIVCAIAVLACMIPCFVLCIRGDAMNRLVGLEAGSVMAAIVLLLLGQGFRR